MTQPSVNGMLQRAMKEIGQRLASGAFPGLAVGAFLTRRGQIARIEGFDLRLHVPTMSKGTVYLGAGINAHPVVVIRIAARAKGRLRWAPCVTFLRPTEAAEWQAVDPAVDPARSMLAELAKWESPARLFLGNPDGDPDGLPGDPNEYGDAG